MGEEGYRVFWTRTAQDDLKKIIEYIALDTELHAQKVYEAIKEKASQLRQFPLHGRVVPELRYFGIATYRELVISPWRIIYKIDEDKVWGLAVIDGRRNVEDLLLDRLI